MITSPIAALSTQDVLQFVEEILKANDVPKAVTYKMNIAVDEIYSNILQYSGASEVSVSCDVSGGAVELIFADDGVPYDPLKKPDPDVTLSVDERQIGGLGIFMVKKSMDSMEYAYKDGKNTLTLKKLLS